MFVMLQDLFDKVFSDWHRYFVRHDTLPVQL